MYDWEDEVCDGKACFTCIWTVENASSLLVSNADSSIFTVKSMDRTNWQLDTFNMNLAPGKFDLRFGLRRMDDDGPVSIEIEFELAVLAADGAPIVKKASRQYFKARTVCLMNAWPVNDVIFNQREKSFPNDTLTVRCRMWRPRTEISKPDVCYARTRLGVDMPCFIWAIREFSSLQLGQQRTRLVKSTSRESSNLVLSFFLSETDGKKYINIQIHQNSDKSEYYMISKFSLLDNEGMVVHSSENDHCFDMYTQNIFPLNEFYEVDKLLSDKSLLLNDVLSLRCEFQISTESIWSRIENYRYLNLDGFESMAEKPDTSIGDPNESSTACCQFKKAFEDMYMDESLSDILLQAGGKSYTAHKIVLSVRSPVLKAMFTQDMREKTNSIIDIPDLSSDTLGHLLLYIYKDIVQELNWESVIDLFRAADKYQILDLQNKCSILLKSNISVTNVISILSLADMHEDSALRTAAELFISKHDNEVFSSDAWQNFKMENMQKALEISERVVSLCNKQAAIDN